jgi:hypothetical protein
MSKHLLLLVASLALGLGAPLSGRAFETAQGVTATPITSLPFTINKPGNYYLPNDLTFSGAGAAITVNADEVVIDLNQRSLIAKGAATSPLVGSGIVVLNHEDVTIQNGDINGFGNFGVLFDATDKKREHNQKNDLKRVNFNGDKIGCLIVSGSIDEVENCNFDQGSIGVEDIASLGGDRIEACNFEAQTRSESVATGTGVLIALGKGVDVRNSVFAVQQDFGVLGSSASVDRIRFCDFNSVPHRFANIAEELAGDQ